MLKIMRTDVHNPFTDEKESCICGLEITLSDKHEFIGGELISVVTEGCCDLTDFLGQDRLDEIEDDCIVEYSKC